MQRCCIVKRRLEQLTPQKNGRLRRRRRPKRWNPRMRQFEKALFEAVASEGASLFTCPQCKQILASPITLECGHTFCNQCLQHLQYTLNHHYNENFKCKVCAADIAFTTSSTLTNVNILVQELVEKWRERNKSIPGYSVPNTIHILGVEPRYYLRSGFAGLQVNEDNKCDINGRLSYNLLKNLTKEYDINRIFDSNKFAISIKNIFRQVESIKTKATRTLWSSITEMDLECILCSRCILEPVTTSCGHTFCRGCLVRVLDHGLSCPLCMATLTSKDYSRGRTFVLDEAIRLLFPQIYNERLAIHHKEIQILGKNSEFPVFVCTNAFPGVACPLYVYEPRYRLLVRRCLESPTRRFAMAAKEITGQNFVYCGTVLEVKDAVSLEDGSFILTTVGIRRFKVISKDEQDGYDTAKVQFIKDSAVAAEKLLDLTILHQKVYNKATKWIRSLTSKVLAEVERLIGPMPKVEKNWLSLPDGPSWTWWLMPILPLSSQLQLGFLSTTSLEKRLRAIDKMLERMEIRMKALERNTSLNCPDSEHGSDSCSDPERTFSSLPFTS